MGRKKGNKPQPNPDGSQPAPSQSSQQDSDTPTRTSQGTSVSESHQGTGPPRGSFSGTPQHHYRGSQGHGSGQRSDFREARSWGTGARSDGSHGQRSDYRRFPANRAQPGGNQYERRQRSDFQEPRSRGYGPRPDGSRGQHADYRRPAADRGEPSDNASQSPRESSISTPQKPATSSISAWGSPSKPAFSRMEHSASVRDEPQAKPTTSSWGVKYNIPAGKERSVSSGVSEERSKRTPVEESAFSKLPEDAPKAGHKRGKSEKGPSKKSPAGNETNASSSKQPVSEKPKASSSKEQPTTEDTTKMMENVDLNEFPMPVRKKKEIKHTSDYMLKKISLEVNYLTIDIKTSNLQIYHYDVNFLPEAAKYLFRPAMVIFVNRHAPGRHPAFDGRRNLYAASNPLPFNNITDEVTILDEVNLRERRYEITVQLVDQQLNLDGLREYLRNGSSMDQPQDSLQAMDIAIRQSLYCRGFVPCRRSFFSPPAEQIDLTGGLELWSGHFQSVVLGWKPYLNVDVAHKAFYKKQTILEFLNASIGNFDPMQRMVDWQRDELKKLITYKIEYQMPPDAGIRKYRVAGIGQTARDTFQLEENGVTRQITVEEYFLQYKRYKIRYPNLPPMRTPRGDLLPLELCSILPNQPFVRKLNPKQTSEMVQNAAQPPNERKQRIVHAIRNARFNEDPCIQEFGVTIGDHFTQVDAWLMKPPKIEYANRNIAEVNNGVWRTNGKFFQNTTLSNWAIINTELRQINDSHKWGIVRAFRMAGAALGLNVEEPIYVGDCGLRRDEDMVKEFKAFKTMPKLVVVIMNNSEDCYGKIKRAAELNSGVLTQCLKLNTVKRMNPMTATNILFKINAKLNGTNHILLDAICPNILKKHKVMIVGADVTHPSPGVESVSIAAVAASHDIHGFKYNMTYRLQTSRMEMIYDLKEMMKEQLKLYEQSVGELPEKILYFRDGVSEGQFAQVKHVELTAIRKACTEYGGDKYMPGTTFLVVQKRHHTRFFPPSSAQCSDKNNNVFAGTVVDQQITHPTEVDFYMVSHQSIKGTARPTKYHLLWDDNDFDLEPLEQLTYYLCHMFARCTRSVSYPAPTYYAHLAAFRGRAWWEKFRFDRALLHDAAALRRFQEQNGNVVLRNAPMFFV